LATQISHETHPLEDLFSYETNPTEDLNSYETSSTDEGSQSLKDDGQTESTSDLISAAVELLSAPTGIEYPLRRFDIVVSRDPTENVRSAISLLEECLTRREVSEPEREEAERILEYAKATISPDKATEFLTSLTDDQRQEVVDEEAIQLDVSRENLKVFGETFGRPQSSAEDELLSSHSITFHSEDVSLSIGIPHEPSLFAALSENLRNNTAKAEELVQAKKMEAEATRLAAEEAEAERRKEAIAKMPPIVVSTTEQMLEIHENPDGFVGRKLIVEGTLENPVYLSPNNINRNKHLGAYLLCFQLGTELFGNYFGILSSSEPNYVCNTKTGLSIKELDTKCPVILSLQIKKSGDTIMAIADSITIHKVVAAREHREKRGRAEVLKVNSKAAKERLSLTVVALIKYKDDVTLCRIKAADTFLVAVWRMYGSNNLDSKEIDNLFKQDWTFRDENNKVILSLTEEELKKCIEGFISQFGDMRVSGVMMSERIPLDFVDPTEGPFTIRWMWQETQARLEEEHQK